MVFSGMLECSYYSLHSYKYHIGLGLFLLCNYGEGAHFPPVSYSQLTKAKVVDTQIYLLLQREVLKQK